MKKIWIVWTAASWFVWALPSPTGNLYLDELGTAGYDYNLSDEVSGNDDGIAHATDSTGNSGGKICSALDFTPNSTEDYATLDEDSIDGATDFTVSIWLKSTSTKNNQALISGARSTQANALLFWFSTPTLFQPHINNHKENFTIPNLYDGTWHHFVFRRDVTVPLLSATGCVIIDGDTAGEICHSVDAATIDVTSWLLAQEQDSEGDSFDINQDWEGYIDEVLIFKSALSDQEVEEIYTNQNNGKNYDGSTRTCQTTPPPHPGTDYNYSDYRFDELGYTGADGEIKDTQQAKDGTAHEVQTVVDGKLCRAIDLTADGTDDYAILPPEVLDGTSDFTIAVWHKGTSTSDSHALLSGANSSQDNEILYWFTNDTTFRGHVQNDQLSITTSSISDGSWHHLVWRLEGRQTCFFFDGDKQGCKNYSHTYTFSIEGLILGQDQDSVGGGFNASQDWEGLVDELLIFRRALSDNEIQNGYDNQNNGKNWDGTDRICPYPSLTKTSCVIDDPVNSSTNPKRIPGATIRYAIELQNPNSATLEHAVVEDNLTDELNAAGAAPKVVSGGCDDCINLSGGEAGDSNVSGNTVTIDFGSVSGGSLTDPTKECGYFDVELQ